MIATIIGIVFSFIFLKGEFNAGAIPSSGSVYVQTSSATTSPFFLTGSNRATTTLQFPSESVDEVTMFIQYKASTTDGVLGYRLQFSNNGVDWYNDNTDNIERYSIFGSVIANSTSTLEYTWNPGTTATATKVVNLRIKPSKAVRVLLYAFATATPATGSVGNVWAEVYRKQNPQ